MANYVVTGKDSQGNQLVSTAIDSIDQDEPVIDPMTIVNAVRGAVAGGTGVATVVVRKYEQTITIV